MKKMSRKKAADKVGMVVEMLKDGGAALMAAENYVLEAEMAPPQSWKESRLKVLMKKGDPRCLENYRPVAILPILFRTQQCTLDDPAFDFAQTDGLDGVHEFRNRNENEDSELLCWLPQGWSQWFYKNSEFFLFSGTIPGIYSQK